METEAWSELQSCRHQTLWRRLYGEVTTHIYYALSFSYHFASSSDFATSTEEAYVAIN